MGGCSSQWMLSFPGAKICMGTWQRSKEQKGRPWLWAKDTAFFCFYCFTVISRRACSSIRWIMMQGPMCQALSYGLGLLRTLLLASDRKTSSNLFGGKQIYWICHADFRHDRKLPISWLGFPLGQLQSLTRPPQVLARWPLAASYLLNNHKGKRLDGANGLMMLPIYCIFRTIRCT